MAERVAIREHHRYLITVVFVCVEDLTDTISHHDKGILEVTEVRVDCEDVIVPSDLLLGCKGSTVKKHVAVYVYFFHKSF
uniref:Uncharacterized protein n=1 Tax=uncultured marine virus TaxID=186617 RepID=A0A0F7L5Q8_9VIRU|nr:hypothetical protein [uncultured marine virus]